MANSLENLTPQILAQILPVLREKCVMPRLVNNQYGTEAAQQGSTIDINDMDDATTSAVVPGAYPNAGVISDIGSTKRQLVLSNWEAATFKLTDKEIQEIQAGTQSRKIEKSVKALANTINLSILNLYKKVYQYTGVAGTTPFGVSTLEAQNAYRILSTALADMDDRHIVLDPFAHANALGLDVLQKVNQSGSPEALRQGMISQVLGFFWHEDQQVPLHTSTATGNYAIDAGATAGATALVLDDGAGAAPTSPAVGDIFTIAGNSQTYTVTSVTAATPTANEVTVGIEPKLVANVSDGALVTFVTTAAAAQRVNLAFQRDAFAFASRPMLDVTAPGVIMETLSDPVSGLTMRYRVQSGWMETIFSVDCLWGVEAIRPQLACRILG